MNAGEFFKGKKVTLMGLGLLGRGVGDAEFLAQQGAILTVTDKKTGEELLESVARLKKYPNITFHLGSHTIEDFTNADMVIKAAGVPLESVEIAAARKAGVPVHMSTALCAKFARDNGAVIVGVTGTRGKSTVTNMLFHILQKAGKRAHLGGNIRGTSTLAILPEIKEGDIVVLELDSWQLQGFGELEMSPHVSIFTTFMPDHLNYYGGEMQKYFADKAHIFLHQNADDEFIAGEQVTQFLEKYGYKKKISAHTTIASEKNLPTQWKLRVLGEHNRYNAGLAIAAADALGIETDVMCEALASFEGIEGRLQFVREVRGVKIYNDNNATTPDATIAAIRALAGSEKEKRVILIMGGSDKGLDMSALWEEILARCKDLYFLAGTGIDRIRPQAPHVPAYNSLKEALDAALGGAVPGDSILFSPAFASFGMFKNEYDRNDQFLRLVQNV